MATCPKCQKYFREPDYEEGEHDCPYCGCSRENEEESDSE